MVISSVHTSVWQLLVVKSFIAVNYQIQLFSFLKYWIYKDLYFSPLIFWRQGQQHFSHSNAIYRWSILKSYLGDNFSNVEYMYRERLEEIMKMANSFENFFLLNKRCHWYHWKKKIYALFYRFVVTRKDLFHILLHFSNF